MPGSALYVLYLIGGAVLVISLAWLALTLYIIWVRRQYAHIPSPRMSSFYFGHAATLAKCSLPDSKEIVGDHFLKWALEMGGLYVIFIVTRCLVIVTRPEDVKVLLMSAKIPKCSYGHLVTMSGQRFLGKGLVTVTDYNEWSPKRRLYDPAFTKSYLKELVPMMNKCMDKFLDKMESSARNKTPISLRDEFALLTLNVISKVAFGDDFEGVHQHTQLKYAKGNGSLLFLLSHALEGFGKVSMNPLLPYLHPYITEGYREAVRALRSIGRDCIQKRIQALEGGQTVPYDILTCILKTAKINDMMDIEDLVDDFVTFYVAGQETTSNACSFTMYLLNKHPGVLARVLDEISEVLGDKTELTASDLDNLPYLQQVLFESLRIYPAAPGTVRCAEKSCKLDCYDIPAGTELVCSSYVMHRLPENFEDPLVFDPERFSSERPKLSSFVYFPFSIGPRACIGKNFGIMEAKLILARLLHSYRIHIEENYELVLYGNATLRPKDPMQCMVEKRK